MEECAVCRVQATTGVSAHLASVLMVVHVLKVMGWKLHAHVPRILLDLTVQHAFLVSCLHPNAYPTPHL